MASNGKNEKPTPNPESTPSGPSQDELVRRIRAARHTLSHYFDLAEPFHELSEQVGEGQSEVQGMLMVFQGLIGRACAQLEGERLGGFATQENLKI